jgi:ATPase subunit of ABC transporter with duplicated ATPase domains
LKEKNKSRRLTVKSQSILETIYEQLKGSYSSWQKRRDESRQLKKQANEAYRVEYRKAVIHEAEKRARYEARTHVAKRSSRSKRFLKFSGQVYKGLERHPDLLGVKPRNNLREAKEGIHIHIHTERETE